MSGFAASVCRRLAEAADYFVPCPHSSIVAMPGCEDWLRSPRAFTGGRGKGTVFATCSPSCGLCVQFERGLGIAEDRRRMGAGDIAAAWRRHLMLRARALPGGRETANLRRLDAQGRIPSAMRAELADILDPKEPC